MLGAKNGSVGWNGLTALFIYSFAINCMQFFWEPDRSYFPSAIISDLFEKSPINCELQIVICAQLQTSPFAKKCSYKLRTGPF